MWRKRINKIELYLSEAQADAPTKGKNAPKWTEEMIISRNEVMTESLIKLFKFNNE